MSLKCMSTATFADLGFRDVAGRFIVVECPLLERLGEAGTPSR